MNKGIELHCLDNLPLLHRIILISVMETADPTLIPGENSYHENIYFMWTKEDVMDVMKTATIDEIREEIKAWRGVDEEDLMKGLEIIYKKIEPIEDFELIGFNLADAGE